MRSAIALGALGLLVLYLGLPPTLRNPRAVTACLPPGITLSTMAEYHPTGTMSWVKDIMQPAYNEITVEQKLAEIGACAKGGKLYDAGGKAIRFFRGNRDDPHKE
jgi:hypothetical protein